MCMSLVGYGCAPGGDVISRESVVTRTCCHQWLRYSAAYLAEWTQGSRATGEPDMTLLRCHGTTAIRSKSEQATGVVWNRRLGAPSLDSRYQPLSSMPMM